VSRRGAIGVGVALAFVYVGGAAISGHLDPLDRRPLLDGLAPPPAYEWVEPPAALASTNTAPEATTFRLTTSTATYEPSTGSVANVYATGNYQATLALQAGAIPPHQSAQGAVLTFTPFAPTDQVEVPDGYQIAGNVVQITASYQPSGGDVTVLGADAQLTLAYPLVFGGIDDTVLTSSDGRRWAALRTSAHPGQQLVVARIDRLGFFAVGQTTGSDRPGLTPAEPSAESPVWLFAAVGVLGLLAIIAIVVVRAGNKSRPARPRRPPPPREDDSFDPWKG
jgi:hypothetical protein